jgi:carboxymethylenebutenolidase
VSDEAGALARLGGPVLGVFGAEDDSIPLADVRAFEAELVRAGVEHEVRVFDGVGLAFVRDAEAIAHDPVQAQAWQLLRTFLQRHLTP